MTEENAVFSANLRALELFDLRSAACIDGFSQLPKTDSSLEKRTSHWTPPILAAEDTVVLLGVGDGFEIMRLLDAPHTRILAMECEPAVFIALLKRVDLTQALAAGRLRFLLMPASSAVSREISLRECNAELIACLHRPHGTVHFVSTASTTKHAEFYGKLRQSAQDAIGFVKRMTGAVAPATVYDVTVISPCCAIFDDLAHCFVRLGVKTQLLRIPDVVGTWTSEQRQAAQIGLASAPSRLVITRNRALFESEMALDFPLPEAMLPGRTLNWWWDVPNLTHHIELRHPRGEGRALGFARDILPLLPQGAEWLPPGARTPFVEAGMQPEIEQDIGISFVGQSRLQGLHANLAALSTVLRELGGNAAAFGKDLDSAPGYVALHRYLAQHHADIKEEIAALSSAYPAHAYFLDYLLEMAVTGAFRIAGIERLAAEGIEFSLYGDDDWLKVPGVTVAHFKGLIAPEDLPTLFKRSRINLNLNFMQVSSTINPKVLDIVAAGGVALTDYRPELELLYPDPAVRPFAFKSIDELPEMVNALLALDLSQYRRAVREHTCRHHTLQQRALWIARQFGLLQQANL